MPSHCMSFVSNYHIYHTILMHLCGRMVSTPEFSITRSWVRIQPKAKLSSRLNGFLLHRALHCNTFIISYNLTLKRYWQIQQTTNCDIFLMFVKTGSDTSCKLSPKETICMKCPILFSSKEKKNISKCHLLKFLPSMQSV